MTAQVLVVRDDIERIYQTGDSDGSLPRLPLSYPFWGGLRERGFEVEVHGLSGHFLLRKPRVFLNNVTALNRKIEEGTFDVVIVWGSIGGAIAALNALNPRSKVRTVLMSYTNCRLDWGTKTSLARVLLYRIGLNCCDRLLLMTQEQIREAVSEFGWIAPLKVGLIPVGVDTEFFRPTRSVTEEGEIREDLRRFVAEGPYIVVAGDQQRSEERLVRILRGQGLGLLRLTQEDEVEEFWASASAGFRVYCRANISFHEVRYAYQKGLLLLNAVDNTWQPAGWTVLTEAMACALPVVMRRGLVTREIGRLAGKRPSPLIEIESSSTIQKVRNAIAEVASDECMRRSLARRGRKLVEKQLRVERTATTVQRTIEELL